MIEDLAGCFFFLHFVYIECKTQPASIYLWHKFRNPIHVAKWKYRIIIIKLHNSTLVILVWLWAWECFGIVFLLLLFVLVLLFYWYTKHSIRLFVIVLDFEIQLPNSYLIPIGKYHNFCRATRKCSGAHTLDKCIQIFGIPTAITPYTNNKPNLWKQLEEQKNTQPNHVLTRQTYRRIIIYG